MAWKMVGDPKTRRLTRSLAEEFSGMTPAPHDRPLNPTRCAIIRKAVELGRFRTCEWAKAYCEETKQTYRINGKHTSTTFCQMTGEFPKNSSVIVEEYKCETLEDVASLYCTFDTRSSARTTGDINLIYAACCEELDGVHRLDLNLSVSGIAYAIWEDGYTQRSAEERAQLSIANHDFVLWMTSIVNNSGNQGNKQLRRASVVAAMFKTWQKSKSASTEFWSAVRDESGTKPDMPDRKLAKFLAVSRITKRGIGEGMKRVGQREVYVKCIHAWNAWRNGEPTSLSYFEKSKTPAAQ